MLFRRSGWGEADYDAWSARLLVTQIAFVAVPLARRAGRAPAFLHPETTLEIVDEILAAL